MNDQMQCAIEMLVTELERIGGWVADGTDEIRRGVLTPFDRAAIRAITAALSAEPEGFVLVRAGAVKPSNCGAAHHHCCYACGADLGGLASSSKESGNG